MLLQEPVPKTYRLSIRGVLRVSKMTLKVSLFNVTMKKRSTVTAQTVPPDRGSTPLADSESVLDPELTDFCSCLHITPEIREFHDNEDDSNDSHPCVSNQSLAIEEETELKRFTQAFKRPQIAVLESKDKNKRGKYSKKSKKTLKHHQQVRSKLMSEGFLPLDLSIKLKLNPEKQKELTGPPELDKVINVEDLLEGASDEPDTLARDTSTYRSVNGTSEDKSEKCLPMHNTWHSTHPICLESEESEVDDSNGDWDYGRMSDVEIEGDKEIHTASKHFEDLQAVLAHQG